MNKTNLAKWLISGTAGLLAITILTLPVQAGWGNKPKPKTKKHGKAAVVSRAAAPAATPTPTFHPSAIYNNASHVANGASLRNVGAATIRLRGMPPDAIVRQAWLYWDFTALANPSIAQSEVVLRRLDSDGDVTAARPVVGTQIGSGPDACWVDNTSNFAFRASVTDIVNGNGDYMVSLSPNASSTTEGTNPWSSSSPTTGPLAEGASLVAIYTSNEEPMGTVLLYDTPGLAGSEFVTTPNPGFSYRLSQIPVPAGNDSSIFTEIGADGQTGSFGTTPSGGLQGFLSFKNTKFNNTVIAGPTASSSGAVAGPNYDSDWNGTDGIPLNQLWDTHSHDVTGLVQSPYSSVSIFDNTNGNDCLIGIANVLEVR